ncbi:hypothetical protein ACLB2K_049658 [Fragaria x ananassa]
MTTRTHTYMSGRLLVALMTQPCTLAAPPPRASSILRRPPPSFSQRFIATMTTNNQDHLDALFKQKRMLRTKVRKALKSMDPVLRSQEDDAIQSIVLEAPWFKSSQRLCAYISCAALREVDTSKVLAEILQGSDKDGVRKKLYVPHVEDKNSHMRMLHISSVDDMVANSMDILEPAAVDADGNEREDVLQASDPVDLLLLPGLAFDRSGRRLGRGGGYYDTFLRNYQELVKARNWKQLLLVALSYSPQIVDEGVIAVTEHDVSVDALVSPAGVIPISTTAIDRSVAAMLTSSGLSFHQLFCLTLSVLLLPLPSHSADPDPLQDFCVADVSSSLSVNGCPCKPTSQITSDDFFFDGLSKEGNTTNLYKATVTAGNVLAFPGLNTLGISMNRVDFAPGGINPPHWHPRASESGVVIEGKLLVGFVTTNNVYYSKILSAGQMFVVPRGLVHFQLNVGEGKALAFTAFNSHLPGSAVLPFNMFASTPFIPDAVLTKAFRVDDDVISSIRSKFGF